MKASNKIEAKQLLCWLAAHVNPFSQYMCRKTCREFSISIWIIKETLVESARRGKCAFDWSINVVENNLLFPGRVESYAKTFHSGHNRYPIFCICEWACSFYDNRVYGALRGSDRKAIFGGNIVLRGRTILMTSFMSVRGRYQSWWLLA